ncbi:HTTM domain-containing protein (plasmid) [Curtobacterium sp. TC1]|uniref:HTTM domain-containing protein n=1 Tax=Curtobacterium sp. TC1 TaxID=2862880 RepID=UPI001C9A8F10|nr:HTTM domain-containing protein [Curtobacterium sp. TC1]QZQ53677.1 HTTM domain-containing protein [Curtobacterium sp. TC1]
MTVAGTIQALLRAAWVSFSDACDAVVSRVVTATAQAWAWFTAAPHALHGLAVTRILLGVAIFGEMVSNSFTRDYSYGAKWTGQFAAPSTDFVTFFPYAWVWLAASHPAGLALLFGVVAGAAVMLILGVGTRVAIITLLILWVGLGQLTTFTADQSDNLIRIALTLLFFTDPSSAFTVRQQRPLNCPRSALQNAAHNGALAALGAQVCFIYAAGGLYKAGGQAWAQGWAIYDPLHVKQFSTWPELADLVTAWGPGVALMTTLTVLVQMTFPVLLLTGWTRRAALIVLLGFHIGIGILMGLPWFSISAVAIDAVFIRERTWQRALATLRAARYRTEHILAHDRPTDSPSELSPAQRPAPIPVVLTAESTTHRNRVAHARARRLQQRRDRSRRTVRIGFHSDGNALSAVPDSGTTR